MSIPEDHLPSAIVRHLAQFDRDPTQGFQSEPLYRQAVQASYKRLASICRDRDLDIEPTFAAAWRTTDKNGVRVVDSVVLAPDRVRRFETPLVGRPLDISGRGAISDVEATASTWMVQIDGDTILLRDVTAGSLQESSEDRELLRAASVDQRVLEILPSFDVALLRQIGLSDRPVDLTVGFSFFGLFLSHKSTGSPTQAGRADELALVAELDRLASECFLINTVLLSRDIVNLVATKSIADLSIYLTANLRHELRYPLARLARFVCASAGIPTHTSTALHLPKADAAARTVNKPPLSSLMHKCPTPSADKALDLIDSMDRSVLIPVTVPIRLLADLVPTNDVPPGTEVDASLWGCLRDLSGVLRGQLTGDEDRFDRMGVSENLKNVRATQDVRVILMNLLLNAAKHSRPNTPIIVAGELQGSMVQISVRNAASDTATTRVALQSGLSHVNEGGLFYCRFLAGRLSNGRLTLQLDGDDVVVTLRFKPKGG